MQDAADSSLEIRIFGLPHRYADDAIIAARNALSDIARRRPALAQERWSITVGDPYARGTQAIQSSVRIRYAESERLAERSTLENMASLLDQLNDDGLEAFWSGAPRNDRRNIGDFVFNWSKDSQRPIDRRAASDFVRHLCAEAGHEIAGLYDNFGREGNRGSRIFVKFVHVASVSLFEAYAQEKGPWPYRGDTIEYSVPDNFVSLTPTMIATCDAFGEDSSELEDELQGIVEEYNALWSSDERILDTSFMWQDSIFLATCSSLALADFITTKELTGHKAPYEYVYDLNEYLFVPARRRLQYARMDARDRRYRGLEPEPPGLRPIVRSTPPLRPPPRRPTGIAAIDDPAAFIREIYRRRQESLDEWKYKDASWELRWANDRIKDAVEEIEECQEDLLQARRELQAVESEEAEDRPIERSPEYIRARQEMKDRALKEIRRFERQLPRRQAILAKCKAEGRALVAERAIVERVKGAEFRVLFPMLAADDDAPGASLPTWDAKQEVEDTEIRPAKRPKPERALGEE